MKCSTDFECCQSGEKDEVDGDHETSAVDDIDSPRSQDVMYEESKYQLAQKLILILEEKDLKRKNSATQKIYKDEKDIIASNLYKRIHQIPEQYHYLYNHLSLRYEGTGCLERYISRLRSQTHIATSYKISTFRSRTLDFRCLKRPHMMSRSR